MGLYLVEALTILGPVVSSKITVIEGIFLGDEVDLGFDAIGSVSEIILLGWVVVLTQLDGEKGLLEPASSYIFSIVSFPIECDGDLILPELGVMATSASLLAFSLDWFSMFAYRTKSSKLSISVGR